MDNVLFGHVCSVLQQNVPSESVHCCVTSPPYFGLRACPAPVPTWRDGQAVHLGQEETLDSYAEHFMEVAVEIGRVLRPDGTFWLNIGDVYRDGDLLGVPWEIAVRMKAHGWTVRQEVIWSKPNSWVGGCQNRCPRSHEFLFMFTKGKKYYFDREAIRTHGKHLRSVWTIPIEPYHGAHFAAFPTKLVELIIRASTSDRGCCSVCGAPWVRVVERIRRPTRPGKRSKAHGMSRKEAGYRDPGRHVTTVWTLGWEANCRCNAQPVGSVVLDPFLGSGTVAEVAQSLGRSWIGAEIDEACGPLIQKRLAKSRSRAKTGEMKYLPGQTDLFKTFDSAELNAGGVVCSQP